MVFVEGFDFVFDEVNFKFDYSFDFDDEKICISSKYFKKENKIVY